MSTLTGTLSGIHGITEPGGTALTSAGLPILNAWLTFTISGTYVQGGGNQAQLLAVPTAMETYLHNGKTITLLQAAFAAPGDESGAPIGTGLCTVSGANITFPLTGGDCVTEHAAGALGTVDLPIQIFVSYTEQ
jgi:hypothetical protein